MKHLRSSNALATSACVVMVSAAGCTSDSASDDEDAQVAWEFHTRPDLTPPRIEVTTTEEGASAGVDGGEDLVMLGVKDKEENNAPMNGPVIVDAEGDPVWVHPQGDTRWVYDVRVQEYEREPVLTWWRGDTSEFGYGEGEFVVMDESYQEIAAVTTPETHADFHDMTLTDDGTALLISYPVVEEDLSAFGGPEDGYIRSSVVHEVDVETGEVLFEWDALEDIPLSDSEAEFDPDADEDGTEDGTEEAPFDPYHVNSVTEDGSDALLVSARNTHAVYRVERTSGELDWILGGKSSDFEMVGNSSFAWQHDAERQSDGTITLFDNQAAPQIGEESRGLTLEADTEEATVEVAAEYLPPDGRLADSQGNMEVLEDGTVFIGWGSEPQYSRYAMDGTLLQDAELAGGISYRAYLQEWHGSPVEPPKMTLDGGRGYVSWNGATEVEQWRFIAGPDEQTAAEVETVDADGFESSAEMPDEAYIAVEALGADGTVLATAEPGAWP